MQDPLAEALLAGEIRDGATVKIGAAHGKLTIDGKPVAGQESEPAQAEAADGGAFPQRGVNHAPPSEPERRVALRRRVDG